MGFFFPGTFAGVFILIVLINRSLDWAIKNNINYIYLMLLKEIKNKEEFGI